MAFRPPRPIQPVAEDFDVTPEAGALPRLVVVALSDSFGDEWQRFAAAAGFQLHRESSLAALDPRSHDVALLAAGGVEDQLTDALSTLSPSNPIEVAAVGASTCHRTAIAAMQGGASDYFAIPDDLDRLRSWLAERARRIQDRINRLAFADSETRKYRFDGILGESPALMHALGMASRVIPHKNVTVLITGETGTGKELLARAVHYNGPRRSAAFVDINCAALPENLLESELFGHEKGAFTDARVSKPGLFELASGGTVFLDEIGHLALPLQAKILRALQERKIRRVGGTQSIDVDVRIIAATHVDLAAAVRANAFREDLYYRLNVVPIELPPLRARQDDVLALARHFLSAFAQEYGMTAPRFTAAAVSVLRDRDWPGNVRELRNCVERAVLLASGPSIDASDLAAPPAPLLSGNGALPFPAPLDEIVHAAAVRMLERCGGNKSETARRLVISRPRLLRLLGEEADSAAADEEPGAPES